MITLYEALSSGTQTVAIDDYYTLTDALESIRETWMETTEPSVVWARDEHGIVLATCIRHQGDPELCITTYCDGSTECHRCHYVLDADECYVRTDVECLWVIEPPDSD